MFLSLTVWAIAAAAAADRDALHRMTTAEAGLSFVAVGAEGGRAEMATWIFWVQARGVEDFIRVNVSDTADDGLIEKRRFDGNRAARKVFPEIRACQVLRQRLDAEPVEASNGLGFLRP